MKKKAKTPAHAAILAGIREASNEISHPQAVVKELEEGLKAIQSLAQASGKKFGFYKASVGPRYHGSQAFITSVFNLKVSRVTGEISSRLPTGGIKQYANAEEALKDVALTATKKGFINAAAVKG
jgi:hypothetical protein